MQEISTPDFLKKLGISEHVKLNLDKLVIMGEGFGGLTAIMAASESGKFKASVGLTTWFKPLTTFLSKV